ncbi:hypothetical protein ES705_32499 [subsurface metagenome]
MANFKYYQESGGGGRVNTADHVDEVNIINELRVVVEDFAAALGHSKLDDGKYPKDLLAGGTFDIKRITTKDGAVALIEVEEAGLILVTAGSPHTLELPLAATVAGLEFWIIKTDDNSYLITIDGNGDETINGAPTWTGLDFQWAFLHIKSDGSNWVILGMTPLKREAGDINTFPPKENIENDDIVLIEDSEDTYKKKKAKLSNIKTGQGFDVLMMFEIDDNRDIKPKLKAGPMDFYFELDSNGDLQPIEDENDISTINFFFQLDTNLDIVPKL